MIFLLGNALANSAGSQLSERYVDMIAGDVVIAWNNILELDVSDPGRVLFSEFDSSEVQASQDAAAYVQSYLQKKEECIAAMFPNLRTFGMMDTGSYVAYSMFYGIAPEEFQFLQTKRHLQMLAGLSCLHHPYGINISRDYADTYGLKIGDWVILDVTTASGLVNSMEYQIVGIYRDSAPWDNLIVFISDKNFRQLLDYTSELFSSFRIYLHDPEAAPSFASELQNQLAAHAPLLVAETAHQATTFYFTFASFLKSMFMGFTLFILFLIALGIRSTVRMNTYQRMTEIGTLRCIGFNRWYIFFMIVFEFVILAFGSMLLATILSILTISVLNTTGVYIGSEALQYVFAGPWLYPFLKGEDIMMMVIFLIVLALYAPLKPALRVIFQRITDLVGGTHRLIFPLIFPFRVLKKYGVPSALVFIVVGSIITLFVGAGCGERIDRDAYFRDTVTTRSTEDPPPQLFIGDRWYELEMTGDWNMDLNIIRMLAGIWHQMGDYGEIMATALRIRSTSELSWYREWLATADRVREMGEKALKGNHRRSAGLAFLRACNYYRAAEFYLHANPEDPRILKTYQQCAAMFRKAMQLLDKPFQEIQIPYEGSSLRGYLFLSPYARGKAPIILTQQGYDGAMEETKYVADEAIARGYHCLLFEGPGQGLSIRERNLQFRPDWEVVVEALIDYVETLESVDNERIALLGISFGGYCVLRAAAYEPRIAATIANPPYINLFDVLAEKLNLTFINLLEDDPEAFNKKVMDFMEYGIATRWFLYDGMWKFGGDNPAAYLNRLKQYDLTDHLNRIKTPVLIMDGADEIAGKGQGKWVYERLHCPKTYLFFDTESTASLHCQNGALSVGIAQMFDWLDEQF